MNTNQLTTAQMQEITLTDVNGDTHIMGQALFNGFPILFDQDIKPWMSQADLADMFGVSQPAVAQQVKRIAEQGILTDSMYKDFLYVAQDNKTRKIRFYDMTVINIIGNRVQDATPSVIAFIHWAGEVLSSHTAQKYLDDIARLQDHNDQLRHAVQEERISRLHAQRQADGLYDDYNAYLARQRHETIISRLED